MDCCAQLELPIVAVPVHKQHLHSNSRAESGGPVLSAAECGYVLQQAADVLTCAQRRHLEQHRELMSEGEGNCSSGGLQAKPEPQGAIPLWKGAASTCTKDAVAKGPTFGGS
eukprot:scaffold31648_cov20-Tisochrysis_lutea.AAC.4